MRFLTTASMVVLASASLCLAQGPMIGNCPVLPADNIWNTPVDTLPVAANSANYVNMMGPAMPVHPVLGSGLYRGGLIGLPFVLVPGTQTKYPATFRYYLDSDPGPYAVPLNAPIQGGSASTGDRHAIALDTDNCILYELFSAYPLASSWQAGSGAIFNLRSNALRPSGWTSADAAGLPILPGLVRYNEILAGEIPHAIRMTAGQTQKAFVWPARHHASTITDTRYPPMGQRFRLKANFDITPFPPEVQIILKALKKYGAMIADNGTSWFIAGEPDARWNNENLRSLRTITGSAFEAVDVSSLMIDPNSGQAKQGGTPVIVSPTSAVVITQGTRKFTANQSASWSVNGIAGGNSEVGYIDATGLYSAPSGVPNPATVQVQAKGSTSSGTASVTIRYPAPAVTSVSPVSIPAGAFTLVVTGTNFKTGAVVKVNGAPRTTTFNSSTRLTATGSFASAAAAIPVTVANPDGQQSNAINIAVTSTSVPVAISISPATATVPVGKTFQFTATVLNTTNKSVVWTVNGVTGGTATTGRISSTGLYTAPATRTTAPIFIIVRSVADSSKIAVARVTLQ